MNDMEFTIEDDGTIRGIASYNLIEEIRDRFVKAVADETIDNVLAIAGYVKERTCEYREVGSEKYADNTHVDVAYQCSECGYITLGRPRYCPDCGARIVGDYK